jgi:hypothetical protein
MQICLPDRATFYSFHLHFSCMSCSHFFFAGCDIALNLFLSKRFVVQYEDMAAPGVWAHGAETLLAHHTPEATTHALPPQSVTVRGLSPGHTYRFRTKATRSTSSSSSSLSSSWSPPSLPMATPPRRPPPPPPPLVEGLHIDAVDLAWAPDPR